MITDDMRAAFIKSLYHAPANPLLTRDEEADRVLAEVAPLIAARVIEECVSVVKFNSTKTVGTTLAADILREVPRTLFGDAHAKSI